jgi:hypothetical protein
MGSLAAGKIVHRGRSRTGFPNMRLGQDEHAKKAGTDRSRVYRGNRGCSRWSKTAVVSDTFVKHGMTDWTRRKRDVEIL